MAHLPERTRPPDPRSRAGRTRRILHWAVSGAGWAAFVWCWVDVLGRTRGSDVAFSLGFLALSVAIIVTATALWVAYNVSRARRRRSRLVLHVRPAGAAQDAAVEREAA